MFPLPQARTFEVEGIDGADGLDGVWAEHGAERSEGLLELGAVAARLLFDVPARRRATLLDVRADRLGRRVEEEVRNQVRVYKQ